MTDSLTLTAKSRTEQVIKHWKIVLMIAVATFVPPFIGDFFSGREGAIIGTAFGLICGIITFTFSDLARERVIKEESHTRNYP